MKSDNNPTIEREATVPTLAEISQSDLPWDNFAATTGIKRDFNGFLKALLPAVREDILQNIAAAHASGGGEDNEDRSLSAGSVEVPQEEPFLASFKGCSGMLNEADICRQMARAQDVSTAFSLQLLPKELMCTVCTFLDVEDANAIALVSTHFAGILLGSGSVKLWKELAIRCGGAVVEELVLKRQQLVPQSLYPSTLWRQTALSRTRSIQCSPNKTDLTLHDLEDLASYEFMVHLCNNDGKKESCVAYVSPLCHGEAYLELSSRNLKKICKKNYRSLEIEVSRVGGNLKSSLLYSSKALEGIYGVYGGGNFPEYDSMAWYDTNWDNQIDPREQIVLPFVKVARSGRSCSPFVNLIFHWRCRSTGYLYPYSWDDRFVPEMNRTEVLSFLHHRTSTTLQIASPNQIKELQDYYPKPMSEYSFILDVKNLKDTSGNKDCSILYPCCTTSRLFPEISFDIPDQHKHCFPSFDAEQHPRSGFDLNMIFTVYALDNQTGKHAKVYESERYCYDTDYLMNYELSRCVGYEKSAGQLRYSAGQLRYPAGGLDAPGVSAIIHGQGGDVGPASSLELYFAFYRRRGGEDRPFKYTGGFMEHDLLVFLEKGLVWE